MACKEFTCIVCGAKGIDRGNGSKKFCSRECMNYYWGMRKGNLGDKYPSCKYNVGVACGQQECEKCGWNPAVEKMRKEAFA